MAWRAWSAAAILCVAAGCASTPEHNPGTPVLPAGYSPVSHPPPPTPTGESTDDTALENWTTSVLNRADGDTLELIKRDINARIQRLQEIDVRLSYLPPGIALEERSRIAGRIAFEKKRLELIESR
ncbi:MAG TPA: hypothetical protein VJU16_03390 [Planctomycetota bacterium]|nr:hypothetical protein [Planctomycetota bacterium]